MIQSYIKKVLQYLPFKGRKEIQLELEEMIHDLCEGDESPENIKKVLINLGNPSDLALNYSDHRSLIGPAYYGKFRELLFLVLKITLPIIFVTSFFSIFLQIEYQYTILTILDTLLKSLFNVLTAASSIFIILVIIFVILEYTDTQFDLDLWEQSIQTPPTKEQVEKESLFEGILTLVGSTLFLGLISFPDIMGIGSIINGKIVITQPIFNMEVFNQLLPYLYVSLVFSFIASLILLLQRRKSSLLYIIEILTALTYLVLFAVMLQKTDLLHPNLMTSLNQYIPNVSVQTFSRVFDSLPVLFMAITFIDIAYTSYQFYIYNQEHKKRAN